MIEDSDEAMMITAGDAARSKRVDDVRRRGRRSLLLETQCSCTQTEVYTLLAESVITCICSSFALLGVGSFMMLHSKQNIFSIVQNSLRSNPSFCCCKQFAIL